MSRKRARSDHSRARSASKGTREPLLALRARPFRPEVPMFRSVLALVGLLVALCGTGLFVGISIVVWSLRTEAMRHADFLADKASGVADAADRAVLFVREVLDKAGAELVAARTAAAVRVPEPVSPLLSMTARRASEELAGSVDRAHGAVLTASDAVVVAGAALEVFKDNPDLRQLFRIDPEQVSTTRQALEAVAGELRQARGILRPLVAGESPTVEQLNAVDATLGQVRRFTDEAAAVVDSARARIAEVRRGVDMWAWRAAMAATLVCALGAVGQAFMARSCWQFLRPRTPATSRGAQQ